MSHSSVRSVFLLLMTAAALSACQTGSKGETPRREVAMVPFVPAVGTAQLQWVEGRYPNLFDPSSYAVWPGAMPPVPAEAAPATDTAPEATAPAAPAQLSPTDSMYVDIECRIASAFADTSIAYDAAGLRGVNVYLLQPDGIKLRPAQIQRGSELLEEPRGALRYFARTNHIIFSARDMNLNVAADGSGMQGVRLVLEGYGSTYVFEWPAKPPAVPVDASPGRGEAAREGARSAWGAVRRAAHNFD